MLEETDHGQVDGPGGGVGDFPIALVVVDDDGAVIARVAREIDVGGRFAFFLEIDGGSRAEVKG